MHLQVHAESGIVIPTMASFYKGKVEKIISEETSTISGSPSPAQTLLVTFKNESGNISHVTVLHGAVYTITEEQKLEEGQSIIISGSDGPTGTIYNVYDLDRSTPLILLFSIFIGLVVFITRQRGLGALIGLAGTIAILMFFIVPFIIQGYNPAFISLIGAVGIASTSLFLAHGFKKTTLIAWMSTVITLLIAVMLAHISILVLHMTGGAKEEVFLLTLGGFENIKLQGLLLGGMIIGTLGVLDDVTTAQVAAVIELKNASTHIAKSQLLHHALLIGKEHILAVVNTLVLAYAGGALPLFIIFTSSRDMPLWVVMDNEIVVEEIVRTLIGSIALVLAVPITTLLAVQFVHKSHHKAPSTQ